jgi:hypothetical protein
MSDYSDLKAAIYRQLEADRQIRENSGPIYDKFIEGTRVGGAAWQAAGRPRQVSQIRNCTTGDTTYFFTRSLKNRKKGQDIEPATEDDWIRWQAWTRERDRLCEQLKTQK